MPNPPVIQITNFCKTYEEHIAVRELSLSVEAGQVVGLIGANGAGKTTTLRALTGIIPGTSGSLKVGGFDVESDPIAVKRVTAYVPDDPQLFNDLTVFEHFAFVGAAYQVDEWEDKMFELVETFDLTEKLSARASELSRGMRQKLAIGCAYLYEPQALLLDEPMTGLDPRGIRRLKASISQQAERQAAVIISSHLLAMVEDICTHVVILDQGQRRFMGPIAELKSQFANGKHDSSLEEVFFHAVDLPGSQPTSLELTTE